MKIIFWTTAALFLYTYSGYPAWLWIRCRVRPRPVRRDSHLPSVSIVLAVRNEAEILPSKLMNLANLNYPTEKTEIIVSSDASIDSTDEILRQATWLQAIISETHCGKAAALNRALSVAKGEVVIFTDARQMLDANAVRNLAENFADPEIGCVSGELMLRDENSDPLGKGLGLYWRFEKIIRRLESCSGSVVGATGALYAVRRELVADLPSGTILDDVLVPMRVARQNQRVAFDSTAVAWDLVSAVRHHEFRRKVRTLLGNYQLLLFEPWLLTWNNPLLFEYVSHKLLRLLGPLMLVVLLSTSASLPGGFYRSIFALQLVFYLFAMLTFVVRGESKLRRGAEGAFAFLSLNAAAAVAFCYFVAGKRGVWTR